MTTPTERASSHVRSGRINRRPPSFAVVLIALAIVFAIAWMFFVRSGSSVPTPAIDGIQGTYTWVAAPASLTSTGTFSAVASGDAGGRNVPDEMSLGLSTIQSAYDPRTRTETKLGGHGAEGATRTIDDWPPAWRVATRSPLDYQGLAAIVRAAVEDGDHAVGIKPLKQGDRTVWRAAMRMDGKVVDVVVDQETGIVTWESDGVQTFTATVDWTSPPPAGTTYRVDVPAGTPVKTTKVQGLTYAASPAAAGKTAGYDPLVSDLAPDGFKLKAVATWKTDYSPVRWLSDMVISLPIAGPGEPLVAQLHTRGLSWFTTEQIGPKATKALGAQLGELLASAKETQLSFQETTLQYGALKGRTASTWYQPSGPSLFVMGARRAVFVTGALTRQELIAYAEGLKPVPAGAK